MRCRREQSGKRIFAGNFRSSILDVFRIRKISHSNGIGKEIMKKSVRMTLLYNALSRRKYELYFVQRSKRDRIVSLKSDENARSYSSLNIMLPGFQNGVIIFFHFSESDIHCKKNLQ